MKFIENKRKDNIESDIQTFINLFEPIEENIIVMIDNCTSAYYIEVHIKSEKLIELSTIDVPLDPEEQGEFRANRDVVEDHVAFKKMKEDAEMGRTFSNIVAEYNTNFLPDKPIKIIGGQHRIIAIGEALKKGINQYHGLKVYFDLNNIQRLDVQLISNTNIVVASDLLDRMFETVKGPELRNWCHESGLLSTGEDFSDKKERTSNITVRLARTFIISYLEGRKNKSDSFDQVNPLPIIAKTGSVDDRWEEIRKNETNIWKDPKLIAAARQFSILNKKQIDYYESRDKGNSEYAYKAMTYSLIASWAYVSGLIEDNDIRLKRHFDLYSKTSSDPLNSISMSKGRHKTDPENYRGLGTRTDRKELGRLAELFFLQAEKGNGISTQLVELAIKKYHAKIATLEVLEAEKKMVK